METKILSKTVEDLEKDTNGIYFISIDFPSKWELAGLCIPYGRYATNAMYHCITRTLL